MADLKARFISSHGVEKKALANEIKEHETDLREKLPEHSPDGSVDWRVAFAEVFRDGGFDIALENPPYVRMELFKNDKPLLKETFPAVYDGSADLYVYFFARTHQILRPGGVACVITTNKWLKAGYAERLRKFFSESAWVAAVVDFGHAKQIFQSADVFPSIVVLRRPTAEMPPMTARVCSIPRDQLQLEEVARQVANESFLVQRDTLGAEAWTLESAAVTKLMDRIREASIQLTEFINGVPFRGIMTGFNDAFLLDTPTKNSLVEADPKSAPLFRPYMRGQDLERWQAEWRGLWMLALRSSGNHDWPWAKTTSPAKAEAAFKGKYPAIHAHMCKHRAALMARQDQGEHWWELRACAYWEKFDAPKVMYQDITWNQRFCFDSAGMLSNNTVYFLPTTDFWPLAVLNAPVSWWFAWRTAQHGKDEALRFFTEYLNSFPIPKPTPTQHSAAEPTIRRLVETACQQQAKRAGILDWLRTDFAVEKPSQKLQDLAALDEDAFVAEVQRIRGRRQLLSAAGVKALKDEHVRSVRPLQALAAEARRLEARVADLVNQAYGLTPEEVSLMWATAPPRMPGFPPGTIEQ
jgi:hypothetical protein